MIIKYLTKGWFKKNQRMYGKCQKISSHYNEPFESYQFSKSTGAIIAPPRESRLIANAVSNRVKGEAIEEKLKFISEKVIFAPRASTQQIIMNGMM